MEEKLAYTNSTEAVGIFHSAEDFQAAVDDLLVQGFNRADLSILASEAAIEAKLHESYLPVREMEDRADVPTTAFVSKESIGDEMGAIIGTLIYVPALVATSAIVASGGTLAAAVVAAAITGGLGGSIGTVLAMLIGKQHSDRLEEQLQQGGLLLWVRTRNEQYEKRALGILVGHKASDVHLHTLPSLIEGECSVPTFKAFETDSGKSP